MKDTEDSVLIRDFKNGDIDSYNSLVKKYGQRLYYVIFGMTRDHKSTDDLLQETFIKLYYSIHTYKEQYPFYPWIYRIAVNLTINHLKKHSLPMSSLEGDEIQLDSQMKGSAMTVDVSNPEQALQNKELFDEVTRSLKKLSPALRAVFALRIFDGRTYNEIAQILNCSLGTVMSRLNRAREKMKKSLSGYINIPEGICPDVKHVSI